MPHLSLLYGKLQIETKEAIAARFGFLSGQSLEAGYLALWRVSGPPQEWKYAKKFRLT